MEKITINSRKIKTTLIFLGALSIFIIGSFLGTQIWSDNEVDEAINADKALIREGVLALASPSFSTTFLDKEAGISLYTDLDQSLDLSIAKTVYKTIESETSDYIIGSVSLPDLSETDDVHCFVHKDGWIVVYYLKTEPVSKIIDWNWYSGGTLSKTKMQIGLDEMCVALIQKAATNINYYHFQYPYANKVMIIIETQENYGTSNFNFKLPSEFTFYERSWSHRAGGSTTKTGLLTAIQLSLDTFHTIEAQAVYFSWSPNMSYLIIDGEIISDIAGSISEVGIVLVYNEP